VRVLVLECARLLPEIVLTARNISITFHTDVYRSRPWFQIPRAVARLLGVKSGDVLAVDISKPDGELLYHGFAKMDSGTEVYDAHIGKGLKRGAEIRVTVSLPPYGTVIDSKRRPKLRQ
jgi:hypothetical protein